MAARVPIGGIGLHIVTLVAAAWPVRQLALPRPKDILCSVKLCVTPPTGPTSTPWWRPCRTRRRGEILADLTLAPPDWPEPEESIPPPAGSGTLAVAFETTWGSNLSPNPLGEGTINSLLLNGSEEPVEGMGVFAGHSSPAEGGLLAEVDKPASIVVAGLDDDGPDEQGADARVPDAAGDFQTVDDPTPGAANRP